MAEAGSTEVVVEASMAAVVTGKFCLPALDIGPSASAGGLFRMPGNRWGFEARCPADLR
jgi:hypothetical protein